ncbi:MAG: putative zinc-binding metallopeptidase [Planctomycetia bacterium]|nr:putative zinc-binding metallopeptidase [Planctomycetia bacterium]
MKIFHCDHCGQLVFFENVHCLNCNHTLAYLPDRRDVGTLKLADDGLWRCEDPQRLAGTYRLCQNYVAANICNWAVPADDPNPLCRSCRLTRIIPNLSVPGHHDAWYKLELAKRRLLCTLLTLGLPLHTKAEHPQGLAFEFLADPDPPDPTQPPVHTGHAQGVITVNVAEADDAERERRRLALHEPYRTLLGHFRHESAHYYWDRLIAGSRWLEDFRSQFGDEREDYGAALQRHYDRGPPGDWPARFVSAYASSHAWEDWAESWAHYLHMADTLETAAGCGLSLQPRRPNEPRLTARPELAAGRPGDFDKMIADWFALTYLLNNLNRGLGLPDGYPFVLSSPAIEKLRFVHRVVRQ